MNGINFLHKNKIIHYGINPKFVCCLILLFFRFYNTRYLICKEIYILLQKKALK